MSERTDSITGNARSCPSDLPALTAEQRTLAEQPGAAMLAIHIMDEWQKMGYWRVATVSPGCHLRDCRLYDELIAAGVMRTVQPNGKGHPYEKATPLTRVWCLTARAIFDESHNNNALSEQKE